MNNIIAIAGLRNAGKSEVSQMVEYCLNTPSFMWNYKLFKLRKFIPRYKFYKIEAFANPMKKMLATLLNIKREKFEDRDFKENYYIDFSRFEIVRGNQIPDSDKLNDNQFSRAISRNESIAKNYFISFRQLMQYFGTEIMRNYFGDDLWILATLHNRKRLIISDLRFKVEAKWIKKYNGKIIYIQRDSCKPTQHISEQEILEIANNKEYDYIINNNGSIEDLFNEVKKVIKQIK